MTSMRWLGGLALAIAAVPAIAAEPQIRTITQQCEVRSGPSMQYYATSTLRPGERVSVVGSNNGMLEIRPPEGSFDLVSSKDLDIRDGNAVVKRETALRRGSSLNAENEVALITLQPGTQLKLLSGAPVLDSARQELLRVSPPPNDTRYIFPQAVGDAAAPGGATSSTIPNIPTSWGGSALQAGNQPAFPATAEPNWGGKKPGEGGNVAQQFNLNPNQAPPSDNVKFPTLGSQGASGTSVSSNVMPTSYPPPPQTPAMNEPARGSGQDRRHNDLIPPTGTPSYAQGYAQPVAAPASGYGLNPVQTSRRVSQTASLSNDPQWTEAERLESMGEIKLSIELYDEVGKKYGQIDPNLALRAMNRAQYLRNEISAGVAHTNPFSRSAKQDYTGKATTDAYPSFSGRSNVSTINSGRQSTVTDVYAKPSVPSYLPENPTGGNTTDKNLVNDMSQPTLKANKPDPAATVNAQMVWSVPGMLGRTTMRDPSGKQFYRLTPNDTSKNGLVYCVTEPGVNLDAYVNRQVRLYGEWGFHREMKQNYMKVREVTPVQ